MFADSGLEEARSRRAKMFRRGMLFSIIEWHEGQERLSFERPVPSQQRVSARNGFEIPEASRSLQSICMDHDFVIRFGRIGCGGNYHGCEGYFGKEVCCAVEL
jgi:hypothetical protein